MRTLTIAQRCQAQSQLSISPLTSSLSFSTLFILPSHDTLSPFLATKNDTKNDAVKLLTCWLCFLPCAPFSTSSGANKIKAIYIYFPRSQLFRRRWRGVLHEKIQIPSFLVHSKSHQLHCSCSLASSLSPTTAFTFTLFVVASRKIRCRHRFAVLRIHGKGEKRQEWCGEANNRIKATTGLRQSNSMFSEKKLLRQRKK